MLWGNSVAIENRMAHTLRLQVNYLKSERNRIKKKLSHIRLSIHLSNCIMPWIGMNGGWIWMQLFCVCFQGAETSLCFLAVLWHVECYFMCLRRFQSPGFLKSCQWIGTRQGLCSLLDLPFTFGSCIVVICEYAAGGCVASVSPVDLICPPVDKDNTWDTSEGELGQYVPTLWAPTILVSVNPLIMALITSKNTSQSRGRSMLTSISYLIGSMCTWNIELKLHCS